MLLAQTFYSVLTEHIPQSRHMSEALGFRSDESDLVPGLAEKDGVVITPVDQRPLTQSLNN